MGSHGGERQQHVRTPIGTHRWQVFPDPLLCSNWSTDRFEQYHRHPMVTRPATHHLRPGTQPPIASITLHAESYYRKGPTGTLICLQRSHSAPCHLAPSSNHLSLNY